MSIDRNRESEKEEMRGKDLSENQQYEKKKQDEDDKQNKKKGKEE